MKKIKLLLSYIAGHKRQVTAAVIEKDGAIHAFADIWSGARGGEFAIDLMRHDPGAPNGIMEFLFTNLAIWGREQGYAWFNLGIAPMSGVKSSAPSSKPPAANRISTTLPGTMRSSVKMMIEIPNRVRIINNRRRTR